MNGDDENDEDDKQHQITVRFNLDKNKFRAICEHCGQDIDVASDEWPELNTDMKRMGWVWANLGPNLANHARACTGRKEEIRT